MKKLKKSHVRQTLLEENKTATVLKVLSITILIDSKIHPAEPKELNDQMKNLQIFVSDNPNLANNSNIKSWCSKNWDSILTNLNGVKRNDYVKKALEAITDEYLQQSTYLSMSQICHCDNEFHETEDELLTTAAKIWNLE